MTELLITCFLAIGQSYMIPDGWKAVEVYVGGFYGLLPQGSGPLSKGWVRMRRDVSPGAVVTLPLGCETEARGRE